MFKTRLFILFVSFVCALTTQANTKSWIEPNAGQTIDQFDYVARASDATYAISASNLVIQLKGESKESPAIANKVASERDAQTETHTSQLVNLKLIGADSNAKAINGQPLKGVTNYFRGANKDSWISNIPHLEEVRYENVYPGIDVVYRLNEDRLEYDFEVSPDGKVSAIRLGLDGASEFELTQDGTWIAKTESGELSQFVPTIYQVESGQRHEVDGSFKQQENGTMGFTVAAHDRENLLVIDPIIEFSGYAGGSSNDGGFRLLENSAGNYVLQGTTRSVDFPGAPVGSIIANQDVFVMELDATSGAINWVSIIGGAADDWSENMAMDSLGNHILVGYTGSDDYPLANAFQSIFIGNGDPNDDSFSWDATVTKLSADGSSLVFSTYLGGTDADFTSPVFGFEWLRGVSITDNDEIYVAGQTAATDFPVTHLISARTCMETDFNMEGSSFTSDIIVAKFAEDGELLLSTCFGGAERDGGRGVEIGPDGDIFISGFGRSPDLPGAVGVFQPMPIEPNVYSPFVIKMDSELSAIEYATYVGEGIMQRVSVDDQGNIYGSGVAFTDLFPTTPSAFQPNFSGIVGEDDNAFVFKLNADALTLDYATYLAGSNGSDSNAIEVDESGRAYVLGNTDSADFPVKDPIFGEIGSAVGGIIDLGSATNLQDIAIVQTFDTVLIDTSQTFIARNGINIRYGSTAFGVLGTEFPMGTASRDSRAVTRIDLGFFGENSDVVFANSGAPNSVYSTDLGTGDYVEVMTFGDANADSRDVEAVSDGLGTNNSVVVANYGEQNEIYNLSTNAPPILVGRTDGNTTSIAVGLIGSSIFEQSIVFANEGQDIRLLPDLGSLSYAPAVILSNTAGQVTSLAIGDIDGNGENDLVVGNQDAANQLFLFFGGTASAPIDIGAATEQTLSVRIYDADEDGDLDLFAGNIGADNVYLNNGGTLELFSDFPGSTDPTVALSTVDNCVECSLLYGGQEENIFTPFSAAPSIYLSVLNPDGSDLEFSTFFPSGGIDSVFRGLSFARNTTSTVLIAGNSTGLSWPQVIATQAPNAQSNAVFMALTLDQDDDGVLDNLDNCTLADNPLQIDSNGDGYGNACDADLNNDGIINFIDVAQFVEVFLSNDADADFNGDGLVNFVDFALLSQSFLSMPGPSGLVP